MRSRRKNREVPRVTQPWYDGEEWRHVRDLVLARDPAVLGHLSVWRTRVPRLPAGVETSASLLEALTSPPYTALSLATAVNRFLNHVSHIGMNMWGVTKLHEAAERLSVPEWIVHLRHETTHGHMPEVTMLRAALEYGLAWLDLHYWSSSEAGSRAEDEAQSGEAGELQRLLECFMYLKLYFVWGTERMSELRSQEDVWSHLQELWRSVKNPAGSRLDDLTVKAAVGVVKTEICSWVDRDEEGVETLADILVQEDLLIPDTEFLESFEDWSRDENREVEVPGQLVSIWADFINLVDREAGVRILVDRLLARIGDMEDQEDSNPELAAAWVVSLAQSMLGHVSHTCLQISPARVDVTCLETWLDSPSPLLAQMTGLLCRVAGLDDSSKVEALVNLASGGKLEAKTLLEARIFTDMNLISEKLDSSSGEKDKSEGWVLVKNHDWDSAPLGKILGSGTDWSSLWLDDVKWSEPVRDNNEEASDEEECVVPSFEIAPLDWSNARGVKVNVSSRSEGGGKSDPVPHFYQDTHYAEKHEIDMFRRRKRLKKA